MTYQETLKLKSQPPPDYGLGLKGKEKVRDLEGIRGKNQAPSEGNLGFAIGDILAAPSVEPDYVTTKESQGGPRSDSIIMGEGSKSQVAIEVGQWLGSMVIDPEQEPRLKSDEANNGPSLMLPDGLRDEGLPPDLGKVFVFNSQKARQKGWKQLARMAQDPKSPLPVFSAFFKWSVDKVSPILISPSKKARTTQFSLNNVDASSASSTNGACADQ
ncbi:hypothetical protein ACOSQ3_007651 [Xanthoceras sorbifolium]